VKRAFTFEELQSGAYFNSLDESDLQFFGMYGQPVLIPCPEDSDQGGWSLQGQTHMHPGNDSSSCITAAQYAPHGNPSSFQISKSYTLVDSLGQSSTTKAPSATRVSSIPPTAGHHIKHNSSMIQQVVIFCEIALTLFFDRTYKGLWGLCTFFESRSASFSTTECVQCSYFSGANESYGS
jgi:hypothetical protein